MAAILILSKNATTADNIQFFGIVAVLVGLLGLIQLVRARRRRTAMQKLAEANDLQFTAKGLPVDFPSDGDGSSAHWSDAFRPGTLQKHRDFGEPYNVIAGEKDGNFLVAFDIDVAWSRSGTVLTLVSVRAKDGVPRPSVPGDFVYTEDGRWRFIQKRRSSLIYRISTEKIEALWNAMTLEPPLPQRHPRFDD